MTIATVINRGKKSDRNTVHPTARKMKPDPIKATFVIFIIIALILLIALFAFCTEVRGHVKAPGINNGQCIPIPTMIDIIKNRFKETVVFKGTNNRGEMVLIAHNPLTKSWTALNSYGGQFLCVVAFGSEGLVMPELEDGRDSKLKPN